MTGCGNKTYESKRVDAREVDSSDAAPLFEGVNLMTREAYVEIKLPLRTGSAPNVVEDLKGSGNKTYE